MISHRTTLLLSTAICLALLASTAYAVPVNGVYQDDPRCDAHPPLNLTHELGDILQGFPIDEAIVVQVGPGTPICVGDDGAPNDFLVTITNAGSVKYVDLFFVADTGSSIGNSDGTVSDTASPGFNDAFRIDNLGVNPNLVGGDNGNLIFEPGESWQFLVTNFVAPASLPPFPVFGSVGLFSNSSANDGVSNASIVAVALPVPEPSTWALAVIGALGMGLIVRRRK